MAEVILDIRDVHDMDNGMVAILGVYSYINRKPAIQSDILAERMQSELPKLILDSATLAYETHLNDDNRYYTIAPSVVVDSLNMLEVLAVMTYDKLYTLCYPLWSHLDFLLACIYNSDTKSIRSNLEANCKRYNISYEFLSFAVTTGNMQLLNGVDVRVFLDVSESLNTAINNIFVRPSSFTYIIGEHVVSLASKLHSPESRIVIYIMHNVLYFEHLMLNVIITQFRDNVVPFANNAGCMLLSKGASSVVFTAKHHDFPDIVFNYGENMIRLKPTSFRQLGE